MYAIIKTGGKQYRVAPEDLIKVEKLAGAPGDQIVITDVLMVAAEAGVEVGAPYVDGASVACELVEHVRGPKIIIFKKKRRKHYRRKKGHRQDLSVLRVTDILTGGKKPAAAKPEKKAAPKPKAAPAAPAADVEKRAEEIKAKLKKGEAVALFEAPAGEPDDLKLISGVGPVIEKKLHALGVKKFSQVAAFTKDNIALVDAVLAFKGRIERDDWVSQAKKLAAEQK